ncbi:MAG: hypothetical protein L3J82_03690 [Planctomycetes bacterium]|nr:hypothetical protein [Planctomycetota bacterium]
MNKIIATVALLALTTLAACSDGTNGNSHSNKESGDHCGMDHSKMNHGDMDNMEHMSMGMGEMNKSPVMASDEAMKAGMKLFHEAHSGMMAEMKKDKQSMPKMHECLESMGDGIDEMKENMADHAGDEHLKAGLKMLEEGLKKANDEMDKMHKK